MFTFIEADKNRYSDVGRVNQTSNQQKQAENLPLASTSLLHRLLFGPEDGGDTFLRNVGLSLNRMTLQSTKPETR
jgi:hypothetical protein